MENLLSSKKAAAAFRAIVTSLGRDDVSDILLNWNDYELSEDGTKIYCYVGRDREYSQGADRGKMTISKTKFIEWLLSDGPFDEEVYGADIRSNSEWVTIIDAARRASGLYADYSSSPEAAQ